MVEPLTNQGTTWIKPVPWKAMPAAVSPVRVASVLLDVSCKSWVRKWNSRSIRPSRFTSSKENLTGEAPANFTLLIATSSILKSGVPGSPQEPHPSILG
jgi:hypothetical protein